MRPYSTVLAALLAATPLVAQTSNDPFPTPINARDDLLVVDFTEFATLPQIEGTAARMMLLIDEPGTERLFVSDMRGPLYSISYDGRDVTRYIDTNAAEWGFPIQSGGRERGIQSFAFHPEFNQPGSPGYGRFYTWVDIQDTEPAADFIPSGGGNTQHTVLLEWVATTPSAATYDGGAPRELMRFQQPYANHNGGQIAFNPGALPGDPEFGMLYVGIGDGGLGGDPLNHSLDLTSGFGKIFRIDPLGSNSANGRYGAPSDNPFAGSGGTLPEIYAYGVRNPQRFAWDPHDNTMYLADIGQNIVEEISIVTAGANLGWNAWEGSFEFIGAAEVGLANQRGDPEVTFPVVEFDHQDPLLQRFVAITGVIVNRSEQIPQLTDLLIFGDNPSGELFYVPVDDLPEGGQDRIRRILLNDGGTPRTLLELIQRANEASEDSPATRADLRFGTGPDGRIFLLNKQDGIIRLLVR